MLKVEGLAKSFQDQSHNDFNVISDITLDVKEGELLCVIGPSGCGKSTLLQLMAGFIEPTSGQITVDDQLVKKPSSEIVLMFQDYALFPWLSVRNNVLFGLSASTKPNEEKNKQVDEYLALVGLSDFADWQPYRLSGGMQQRVALARALISKPRVLLMDEPFSSVDTQYRDFLRQSLVDLWQKTRTTIVFVTHSITEAVCLGNRVVVLSRLPTTIKEIISIDLAYPRYRYGEPFVSQAQRLETLVEKTNQDIIIKTLNNKEYDKVR